MTTPSVFRGQCLCGAVAFEVTAPTKWCANCHCTFCRRAHMAPWVTWVGVEAEQFRLLQGDDALVSYASSEAATRQFCRYCGSTLFFRGDRWPTEVHIARAAFEGAIDRDIAADVFVDNRAQWHPGPTGRPQYGGPTGTTPLS